MTCIVGVKMEDGGVLLGGDSLGSDGHSGMSYKAPKVFRLSKQVAMGYTSSFRMGQLLQHHLTLPKLAAEDDELAWSIKEFIPVARKAMKDHGYAKVENNVDRGGYFLLAIRSRLFLVQSDFSVLEPVEPYDACGSGEEFALGAMHALWKYDLEPKKLLTAALEAASEYAVGVAPPYHFVQTGA